jgi:hypothetical protein
VENVKWWLRGCRRKGKASIKWKREEENQERKMNFQNI